MGLADGIVLFLVACAAAAVVRFMRNQKKAGKTACGCGSCSGCSGGCGCCGGEKAKEGVECRSPFCVRERPEW